MPDEPQTTGVLTPLSPKVIKVDPLVQQRAGGVDGAWAAELADVLREGGEYKDAPVAFEDDAGTIWLAGGFHRHAGAELAEAPRIKYEVRVGTRRDALRFALGDNAVGTRPRTPADKRRAVETALADAEWSRLSDREIDRLCQVSIGFTSRVRKEVTGAAPDPAKSAGAKAKNDAHRKAAPAAGSADRPPEQPGLSAAPAAEVIPAAPARQPLPPSVAPALPRDRLGRLLPPGLVPVFEAAAKIRDAANGCKTLAKAVAAADKAEHVGGFLKRVPAIRLGLEEAAAGLARQQPWCVCPSHDAGGTGPCDDDCPLCRGSGYLTFPEYEALPPAQKELAASFAPGDAWEGDEPPPPGPAAAFRPRGPGLDGYGRPVPAGLRDAFADESLPTAESELRRAAAVLKAAARWNPWLKPTEWQDLEDAAARVAAARAYAAHRDCKGAGCGECKMSGFTPVGLKHEYAPKRGKPAA